MRRNVCLLSVAVGLSLIAPARPAWAEVEVVRFLLYKWQHRVGQEVARIDRSKGGTEIRSAFGFTDRANTVPLSAVWQLAADGSPRRFQLWGHTSRRSEADELVVVGKKTVAITEQGKARTVPTPARFFLGAGYAPVIGTQELLRYWSHHGRPATLPIFPRGQVTIRPRGEDTVTTDDGKRSKLQRYAVDGRSWGQETVWLDEQGALAAYKGIDAEFDPFEATRVEYTQALSGLVARAAADAMVGLGEAARDLAPAPASGAVVYAGARVIDGTGRAPVEDALVVVKGGRIAAVGRRGQVEVPAGARTVDLAGKSLLPGLWDMHAHFAQVEWGPVYLAAGITTVRDCGNELDFIGSLRDTIDAGRGVGPRILLACIVDGEGEGALGNDRLRRREQIPALIRKFSAARCTQVKIYTSFDPDLIAPLAQAAHAAGMTVTGHVPTGIGPVRAVEAGLDQINHIPQVARAFFPDRIHPDAILAPAEHNQAVEQIDMASPRARAQLDVFVRRRTVVDPTMAIYEIFSYPHAELSEREPGLAKVATPLRGPLSTFGARADARSHARYVKYLEVLRALHAAGVPIVAGTDQAVPGHSLHRELELYVQAGFSPMEAIQAATVVPARALKKQEDSGTLEPGKRADLIAVDGNPLADVRVLRRVSLVVAGGREYTPAPLWRAVGFQP